jgi:putative oxidoreductase
MKLATNIVGGLLGFLFIAFSIVFFFKLMDMPPPPEGTAADHFMKALMPTGYMTFVKSLELLGGILVAIPCTRNFGLLVLGPIIINILAFQIFIMKGAMLLDPVLISICLFTTFLLWAERSAFLGLAQCCNAKNPKL